MKVPSKATIGRQPIIFIQNQPDVRKEIDQLLESTEPMDFRSLIDLHKDMHYDMVRFIENRSLLGNQFIVVRMYFLDDTMLHLPSPTIAKP